MNLPDPDLLDAPPPDLGRGMRSRTLRHALGLGLLSGGLESLLVASRLRLALDLREALMLGFAALVAGLLVGLAAALPASLAVAFVGRASKPPRRLALAAGVALFVVVAFHLWTGLGDMARDGRWLSLLATLGLPLGLAGAFAINVQHRLRKVEIRGEGRLGALSSSLLVSLAAILVSTAWIVTHHESPPQQASKQAYNVLVVTLDTLRRDHLSVYGEPEAPPTPHFDAFAAEGLLFTDAVTPMPETAPAHASLFTRLHPLRHGVVSNGDRLSRGFYTLAEHLWFEGWTTGAFVSSFAVDSRTGLDQGFSVYDDDFFPFLHGFSDLRLASLGIRALMRFGDPLRFPFLLERPAPDTLERALRWMELQQAEGRPFFCWVHFFEPHSPYEAHPESPGSDARPPAVDHRWILANEKGFDYSEEVVAELRRLYREEALYTDHQLGRLLEGLEALGVADRTLVVVMADHGEMLGEHGYHFHHHGLYEDALRIPLALRFPGLAPGVETRQARTMDVPVTLEKALRLTPTEPHEGRDLVEMHLDAEARGPSVTLIGRRGASLREGSLYGLRTGRSPSGTPLKYLLEHDTRREELYDLEADPEEREDLSISQPRVVERSRGLVEEELRARKERNDGGRDAAVMEGLRALGYLE